MVQLRTRRPSARADPRHALRHSAPRACVVRRHIQAAIKKVRPHCPEFDSYSFHCNTITGSKLPHATIRYFAF